MELTPAEVAAAIKKDMGKALCVCIVGGTSFYAKEAEELVQALGRELEHGVSAEEAYFVTCGEEGGTQECFARSCGDGSRVLHLVPEGEASSYGVGKDREAGATAEVRDTIFEQLGDVYLVVEGGKAAAQLCRAAAERGATVLPLVRAGGASGGQHGFPKVLLEKPEFASKDHWELLKSKDAPCTASATAVSALLKQLAKKHQASVWELIDELISFERGTLVKAMSVAISILVCISCFFIYQEVAKGDTTMALLHGGFLFLLMGLIGSLAFVITEVTRCEAETASGGGGQAELPPADKKAQ